MPPEEIRYYREKAAKVLGAPYQSFHWDALDVFGPCDDTVEERIRSKHGFPPRPSGVAPYSRIISPYKAPLSKAQSGTFAEQVSEAKGLLSQPNAYTCQSTCIAMAAGRTDIMQIRAELEAIGEPGDPGVMGVLLKKEFGDRYIFDDNACLSEVREWLKAGEFLITHIWASDSGHVICLDGVTIDPKTLGYKFSVKDPYGEFDFSSWSYNSSTVDSFDGDYSSYGIYAAGVAGQSKSDSIAIYQKRELDSMRKGAWIHRVLPAKKT
jgi:hypothetical protein